MTETEKPHRTAPTYHPGSSKADIENEPDWAKVPYYRVEFRDSHGRVAGVSFPEDDLEKIQEFLEHARQLADRLRQKKERGDLLSVVDFMRDQEVGSSNQRC